MHRKYWHKPNENVQITTKTTTKKKKRKGTTKAKTNWFAKEKNFKLNSFGFEFIGRMNGCDDEIHKKKKSTRGAPALKVKYTGINKRKINSDMGHATELRPFDSNVK